MNSKANSTVQHGAYHWPDHTIGKGESRVIRDSHNALYNDYHRLLAVNAELVAALTRAEAGLQMIQERGDGAKYALPLMIDNVSNALAVAK